MTENDLYDLFTGEWMKTGSGEPFKVAARAAARLFTEREVPEGWPEGYVQDEDGLRGNGLVGDDDEIGHSLYQSSEGQWHSTITGRYRTTRAEALEDARRGIWIAHGYSAALPPKATKEDTRDPTAIDRIANLIKENHATRAALDVAITRAEKAEATLAKATTDLDAQIKDLTARLNAAEKHAPTDLRRKYAEVLARSNDQVEEIAAVRKELSAIRKDFTAVCLDCGVVSACDEDRCCESCGEDLILCADSASSDILLVYLKDARKEHDRADDLASARHEIGNLRHALTVALRGGKHFATVADLLNGGDDA